MRQRRCAGVWGLAPIGEARFWEKFRVGILVLDETKSGRSLEIKGETNRKKKKKANSMPRPQKRGEGETVDFRPEKRKGEKNLERL